jgi:hypothetical protein
MNVLGINLPDELAELETRTGVANEDLVRHWLDELAGKSRYLQARAFASAWSDHEAWAKQCKIILDAVVTQTPSAANEWSIKNRWIEWLREGYCVTPDYDGGIDELKRGDVRRRAEDYVRFQELTGIRNAKVEAFLDSDLDVPHFAVPAGGRMRDAFKQQADAVYWDRTFYLHDLFETVKHRMSEAEAQATWIKWGSEVLEPREAHLTAQYNKLARILGTEPIEPIEPPSAEAAE